MSSSQERAVAHVSATSCPQNSLFPCTLQLLHGQHMTGKPAAASSVAGGWSDRLPELSG